MKLTKSTVVEIEIVLNENEGNILAEFLRRYRDKPKDIFVDRLTERLTEAVERDAA